MPDILEMLTAERDKFNRAIEALGGEIGGTLGRIARLGRIVKEETRKTISAEVRARMAAAQKARWAKVKGQTMAPKKKFTMPAAAKAKVAAAQKARWAGIKGTPTRQGQHIVSAEAKAKISKAKKAWWAAKKKDG
jgi:hypothetical protein